MHHNTGIYCYTVAIAVMDMHGMVATNVDGDGNEYPTPYACNTAYIVTSSLWLRKAPHVLRAEVPPSAKRDPSVEPLFQQFLRRASSSAFTRFALV